MRAGLASSWPLRSWEGIMYWQDSCAAWHWEMQSLDPGNTLFLAIVQAGHWLIGEKLCFEKRLGTMVQRAEPKFVGVVRQECHRLGCISPKVARRSRVEGRGYFPSLAHLVCYVSSGHPSTGQKPTGWRKSSREPRMHREHVESVQGEAEGTLSSFRSIKSLLFGAFLTEGKKSFCLPCKDALWIRSCLSSGK